MERSGIEIASTVMFAGSVPHDHEAHSGVWIPDECFMVSFVQFHSIIPRRTKPEQIGSAHSLQFVLGHTLVVLGLEVKLSLRLSESRR